MTKFVAALFGFVALVAAGVSIVGLTQGQVSVENITLASLLALLSYGIFRNRSWAIIGGLVLSLIGLSGSLLAAFAVLSDGSASDFLRASMGLLLNGVAAVILASHRNKVQRGI